MNEVCIRDIRGCILFYCPACQQLRRGNYCTYCGDRIEYATESDVRLLMKCAADEGGCDE